jgi:hypothetical protein
VVHREPELEDRLHVEKFLIEETSLDRAFACDGLDHRLVERLPFFGFDRRHEPPPIQKGEVVVNSGVDSFLDESLHHGHSRVIAQDVLAEDLQHSAFAVAPGAVAEKETLLAGIRGQRIADGAFDVGDHLRVAIEDLRQEPEPGLALRLLVVIQIDDPGDEVLPGVRAQFPGVEVYSAVQTVEEKRVGVEILQA